MKENRPILTFNVQKRLIRREMLSQMM